MNESVRTLATNVAQEYATLEEVEAVALGGSQTGTPDPDSDVDLYVYLKSDLPLETRRAVADRFSRLPSIGNTFWEPGDEWLDDDTGMRVDVMFRHTKWIEEKLDSLLERHEASVGYSTCLWYNVRASEVLYDRDGWFEALQQRADERYPEGLRGAIIARNFPLLRGSLSSFPWQLVRAATRGDRVAVNHRMTALLASYFDVLFAINRVPYPGEKRLLEYATKHCEMRPPAMKEEVEHLLASAGGSPESIEEAARVVVDSLERVLLYNS